MIALAIIIILLPVALFTRAWIEIARVLLQGQVSLVALFTRAWIEITLAEDLQGGVKCRPLHEGVD